jgi:hypothetical protein
MRVCIIKGFNGQNEKEYFLTDKKDVEELFDTIDWREFHVFSIYSDGFNSFDISGNISIDGLSASMVKEGQIYIIENPPETIEYAKNIVLEYLFDKESTYEKYFKETIQTPVLRRRNGNVFFRAIMVVFFLSIILVPIIYFNWNDLKFLGREVEFSRAKVIEIKKESWGGRFFWQIVKYEFEVKGMSYVGEFRGGRRQGFSTMDDEFKIRYLKSDPNTNDFVGRYIKKSKPNKNSSLNAKRSSEIGSSNGVNKKDSIK